MELRHTINPIEVIWIIMCGWTCWRCHRRWRQTVGDQGSVLLAIANKLLAPTTRALIIADENRRKAWNRLYRESVFVTMGVRGLFVPDEIQTGNRLINIAIAILFISLAVVDLIEVQREETTQKRLEAHAANRQRSGQDRRDIDLYLASRPTQPPDGDQSKEPPL